MSSIQPGNGTLSGSPRQRCRGRWREKGRGGIWSRRARAPLKGDASRFPWSPVITPRPPPSPAGGAFFHPGRTASPLEFWGLRFKLNNEYPSLVQSSFKNMKCSNSFIPKLGQHHCELTKNASSRIQPTPSDTNHRGWSFH